MMRVIMPRIDEISSEGMVRKWLKREGENVEKGEIIAVVETVKIESELEAPSSGVLSKILVQEGVPVPVGEVIAIITESEKEGRNKVRMVKEHIKASPATEKRAKKYSIDLKQIKISRPGENITLEDVENFIEKTSDAGGEEKAVPLTGFRKVIAERMTYAARTYAPVTSTWEVDVTELLELRKRLKPEWEKQGIRVTLTSMLIKAVVQVLKENIIFNSTLKDGNIIFRSKFNIGVAMAIEGDSFLEDKLIVPVVHDADKKSLIEIARKLEEIVRKVETGSLTMNDVKGSTFTLSNVGARAYEYIFTPIINPPESAILGVGSITKKPVVRNGEIVIRSTLPLMLTYDHRIILPTDTARFRRRLKELLENPESFIT